MNKNQITKRVGVCIGGISLLAGLSSVVPESTAPKDMISHAQISEQNVVYTDPDALGPLPGGIPRLQGNVVVDLADGTSPSQVKEISQDLGVELKYNSIYSLDPGILLAQVSETEMPSVLERLNKDKRIEKAEPNYILSGFDIPQTQSDIKLDTDNLSAETNNTNTNTNTKQFNYPNDPLYKYQWHLEQIKVRPAWAWSNGTGAIVAVVDTGIAWKNTEGFTQVEDLADTNFVAGYDFVNDNNLALDDNCHGTHVAGTIAQSTNNEKGVAGIAYKASLMPVKVLSQRGYGSLSDIADGICFAANHKANVINMSLGGPFASRILENAVAYAHNKGTLVVCAAGNESKEHSGYPAAFKQSLSVSAVDSQGELTWYTNYGPSIDIAAPGGDTRVDKNDDGMPDGVYQNTIGHLNPEKQGYYAFQGTSMASPHVAGTAALIASQGVTSPTAMKNLLKRSAMSKGKEGKKAGFGAGIVDAEKATRTAGLSYGAGRFICAALASLLAIATFLRRKAYAEFALSLPSIIVGSSGFFFLANILPMAIPHCPFATRGMPAWDIALFGAAGHGNPIFYSCLIPVLLSMLVMDKPFHRAVVAGLAAGFAGHFFFEAMTGSVLVHFVPAFLSRMWLLGNAFFLMFLAQVLSEETLDVKR